MSDEYELYGGTPPHENTPTSREAAVLIKPASKTLRLKILDILVSAGTRGNTDDEIELITRLRHQTVSARRRELVLLSVVCDSGRTRMTRSGRRATVWIATVLRS